MGSAINIQRYLAINQGRYLRRSIELPSADCSVYLTTHFERADTDLVHYHGSSHLSFMLDGGVTDRRNGSEIERGACDLMYFRAGEVHQTIYERFPVRNINIEFGSRSKELDDPGLAAKLSLIKIYNELMLGDADSLTSIEQLVLSIDSLPQKCSGPKPSWIRTIEEVLRDNWRDQISVVELARIVRVHPKTISKAFPRFFGCTYGDLRRSLRVEHSLSMIRSTKLPLTEIAQECGFFDQSHFISAFKRLTGLRPGQFRGI